ncbi:MAG: tetratricopeptide repeat protein [Verrucomicrobia bacterium]|nr:tetratricopeptide repeat protein [Verrucomicrobiota bacterium]MCF7707536.1 tetratricopeptide repeat protein [Verrucomicrobiota bacterium]
MSKSNKRKPVVSRTKIILSIIAVLLFTAGLSAFLFLGGQKSDIAKQVNETAPIPSKPRTMSPSVRAGFEEMDRRIFNDYAGSESCEDCHEQEFELWLNSHHALAERELNPETDRAAFVPTRTFSHGSQTSTALKTNGQYAVITLGLDGKQVYYPERTIGVSPLIQYLIKAPGNRYQVTEIAYHPGSNEWFDVYGEEDRQPGEWGHWSGRGMNWNSMCGTCHNTRFRKNYDFASDSYATSKAEMGVGCEACHGHGKEHVQWQNAHTNSTPQVQAQDPTLKRMNKKQYLHTCGACHSRRIELTGDFEPGDDYWDHFTPMIPDDTDTYYADGQVRDEDFEFASFIGSRMYSLGVRCNDCHDVHSGKLRLQGNALCLKCHQTTINPAEHGKHPMDKEGSQCVDCHMPITVYMARHPRRDHGLTIPDPTLTRDFGIPNACTRCHEDESVQWSIDYVEKWYGDKMQRHTQQRARWLANAKIGKEDATGSVIQMLHTERIPLWRASAAAMLKQWAYKTNVMQNLFESLNDPSPMVRSMAARSLEPWAQDSRISQRLSGMLDDPSRSVRIETTWALRRGLNTNSAAGFQLLSYLEQNLDQPTGALQTGVLFLDRGLPRKALDFLKKAVAWEQNAPMLHQALAVNLSQLGQTDKAVQHLSKACELEPDNPNFQFQLGIALAEVGEMNQAISTLTKAVKTDPNFARAWYNLGLAYNSINQPQMALDCLNRGEQMNPESPDIPYARATILRDMGRYKDAREAARRVLEIAPGHRQANALLQNLNRNEFF